MCLTSMVSSMAMLHLGLTSSTLLGNDYLKNKESIVFLYVKEIESFVDKILSYQFSVSGLDVFIHSEY